jgi:hypothetical protein
MEIPSQFVVPYATTCHLAQQAGKLIDILNQLNEHCRQRAMSQGAYYVEAAMSSQEFR